MIYYFSATGNSRWTAEKLAEMTGDNARSITKMNKDHLQPEPVADGEVLGIVYPIFVSDTPKYVTDFLKKIRVSEKAYVYVVCTCNCEAGYAVSRIRRITRVDAAWSLFLPDNYVAMLPVESRASVDQKIAAARIRLKQIADTVMRRRSAFDVVKGRIPHCKTFILSPLFETFIAKDKKFYADSACISCGKCVQVCPLDNITLETGRPKWHGNCMHCMACIQNCPKHAIQYGKATVEKGRYTFPEKEW